MFSKADNYMNEGCLQSVTLCDKCLYISDLYLQIAWYCFKILWNTETAFLVKILHEATFSGI